MLPGVIRTFTPLVAGWLIGLGLVEWTGLTEADITNLVTVLLSAAYYLVARGLEHVWPKAGVLLGFPRKPVYPPATSEASRSAA